MSVEVDWFLRAHPEITTVEALLPDCNGVMRGKWLPRPKLGKVFEGELKLPKTALSLDIWGRDVEELVFSTGDADGLCRPIEGTLLPAPWSPGGERGQVMLAMYDLNGSPYMGDPAHVLARVVERFHASGWRPVIAAELEFSLVTLNATGNGATLPDHTCPVPASGSPIGGNTYGLDVLNEHRVMMEDLRTACEAQDLPFDGVVKESAPSQYEVNMQHVSDPVLAARQIIMMKRLIKGVAAKHRLIASFMAKPFEEEAGNGMHVHCSVLDEQGLNIFDDGSDKGTPLLQNAIAGCLTYMAESVAIFAPSYNAYRRFQKGCHAPTYPSWGYENRTVAVRVPAGSPTARRLEHRVAGADTNPYLLFAVILSGMLEGIRENLSPGDPISGDGYAQEEAALPVYMPDAVQLFSESDFIRNSLGEELQRIYTLTKSQEIAEFRRRITDLEYLTYLERL
ncbi:glutamine synthetase [Halioglobus japonicus]|uniref:Glutamine synthetase n=1 Tax=Halioglobus japonicus TaxID=930805 RepID=A0AAP8MBB5_9GAMM|nr:glutamine synthetase family protein [Halioglobus japonicus]AQA20002.1 glutamine synthetase [Halioglobus japonicus]PLW84620.1 glutamine synthetase [Halioglobus japonicus]GHD22741.1 glutamine synthetase [Halioglobus japonicus]